MHYRSVFDYRLIHNDVTLYYTIYTLSPRLVCDSLLLSLGRRHIYMIFISEID